MAVSRSQSVKSKDVTMQCGIYNEIHSVVVVVITLLSQTKGPLPRRQRSLE